MREGLGIRQKTKDAIGYFLFFLCFLFGSFILVRGFEYVSLLSSQTTPPNTWKLELFGLFYDFMLILNLSAILFPLFLLIYFFNPKVAFITFRIIGFLLIVVYVALVHYFLATTVTLGADLFGYSMQEVRHTALASGDVKISKILSIVLFSVAFFYFTRKPKFWHVNNKVAIGFFVVLFISFLGLFPMTANSAKYSSEFELGITNNKLGYFISQVKEAKSSKTKIENGIIEYYTDEDTNKQDAFHYTSKEYPFLHTEATPDVLSQYFNFGKTPPNIVFIVVEGLGRAFTGPDAHLGSFTPFLDSLGEHSLYWTHFLSDGGRTFALLPSLFGSLPFAEKGFLEMADKSPHHLGLPSLLKNNGYTTNFYYAGDSHFDLMYNFLKREKIDMITDEPTFDNSMYKKIPMFNGETWGYDDLELYKKTLRTPNPDTQKPFLDIILTVCTHSPFLLNDQDTYIKKFYALIKNRNFSDDQTEEYKKYEKNYSTILFADDAIKYYINECKKEKTYSNTIFIITGDHKMPELPAGSKIDRYHVPLIIFSPMLKSHAQFLSVSSQFDVTPSLLACLSKNWKFKLPSETDWIGHGLDCSTIFRNLHSFPLMRDKNELVDYVDKDYMVSDGQLYQINAKMDLVPSDNAQKLSELTEEFNEYKEKNIYSCFKDKLLPDSLLKYQAQ